MVDEAFAADQVKAKSTTKQGRAAVKNGRTNPVVQGGIGIQIGNVSVIEGNTGTTAANFPVTLSAPSPNPITVDFLSIDGTATTADNDYLPVSGTLVFNPGETAHDISVSVVGDTTFEPDETFTVSLSNATGGAVITNGGIGVGTIINDDALIGTSKDELIHDSRETRDLAATAQSWRIDQKARSSYEIITDALTGDLGIGGPDLQLVASDGTTVLQIGTSVSGGDSKSLRIENATAADVTDNTIRVKTEASGCNPSCDANDTFRIRAYDTTYRVSRFNNNATQVTITIIANPTSDVLIGTLWFWDGAGAFIDSRNVFVQPKGADVFNTSSQASLAGKSGTITFSNNAPYGALTGKAVAVEPATGFTFDTPMVPRPATTKMVPRDN
jgi:hypothetical protein